MSKWVWLSATAAATAVVMGGAGVCWYCDSMLPKELPRSLHARVAARSMPIVRDDGEGEICEPIEPLQVENVPPVPQWVDATEDTPLARVLLSAGMCQPPRPEAESGKVARMPYADEDEQESLGFTFETMVEFLASKMQNLSFFRHDEMPSPIEESENKDLIPPESAPTEAPPTSESGMDYHQQIQHCPYHGGCPYPYYRR